MWNFYIFFHKFMLCYSILRTISDYIIISGILEVRSLSNYSTNRNYKIKVLTEEEWSHAKHLWIHIENFTSQFYWTVGSIVSVTIDNRYTLGKAFCKDSFSNMNSERDPEIGAGSILWIQKSYTSIELWLRVVNLKYNWLF